MRNFIAVGFISIAFSASIAFAGQLEDGIDAKHQDPQRALRLLKPLAEKGNTEAQFHLGQMYGPLGGLAPDRSKQMMWLRQAAHQGHARAQYEVGFMLGSGIMTGEAIDAEAIQERWRWFGASANQGYSPAQFALGKLLFESRLYDEAIAWFEKSDRQGYSRAAEALADIFGEQDFYKYAPLKDCRRASGYYKKGARRGDFLAQYSLGKIYSDGCLPRDYAEAAKWLEMAAVAATDYGRLDLAADAQARLGALYAAGLGVPQDHALAHMWLNLAAAQRGHEEAAVSRDELAAKMIPDQMAEAQRMAREWLAAH